MLLGLRVHLGIKENRVNPVNLVYKENVEYKVNKENAEHKVYKECVVHLYKRSKVNPQIIIIDIYNYNLYRRIIVIAAVFCCIILFILIDPYNVISDIYLVLFITCNLQPKPLLPCAIKSSSTIHIIPVRLF